MNAAVFAWSGDQTTFQVDFYEDKGRTVARTFDAGVTVRWAIVSSDGSTLITSFNGARDATVDNRLVGTITAGAPAAGEYLLYAEVTEGLYTTTLPGAAGEPVVLTVLADPIPGGGGVTPPPSTAELMGWANYNHSGSSVAIVADTWTNIANDGNGGQTVTSYMPSGVTRLMDTSTGSIVVDELDVGDVILIRNDFTITPSSNNTVVEFHYTAGSGAGEYTLSAPVPPLAKGSGVAHRFSARADLIWIGSSDTRDNPIGLQVKCSHNATLVNSGTSITVLKR